LVSTIQFTSDSQDRLPRKDLYESYSTWAEENAQDALKKPAFYEELTTECGDKARPLKSNGENYYEQIQFLEE
jgi:phage/plasmid-associated DNA primase